MTKSQFKRLAGLIYLLIASLWAIPVVLLQDILLRVICGSIAFIFLLAAGQMRFDAIGLEKSE